MKWTCMLSCRSFLSFGFVTLLCLNQACTSEEKPVEEPISEFGSSEEPLTPPESSPDSELGDMDAASTTEMSDLSTESTEGAGLADQTMAFDLASLVIYFDYDQDVIRFEDQSKLEQLASYLRDQGGSLTIEGHCDERGSVEYNLALGQRRAEAVKSYLVTLGIDASNISTLSAGEEKIAVFGTSEEAHAKNRRAVFTP